VIDIAVIYPLQQVSASNCNQRTAYKCLYMHHHSYLMSSGSVDCLVYSAMRSSELRAACFTMGSLSTSSSKTGYKHYRKQHSHQMTRY
jgi:hypothetical protein